VLIEHLNNIEIEVAQGRILLDNYYLFKDSADSKLINQSLYRAEKQIESLNLFLLEKDNDNSKKQFLKALEEIKQQEKQLKEAINDEIKSNDSSINIRILKKYNDFYDAYKNLDKLIHDYSKAENIILKRGILIFVILVFTLLIVSLILIYSLIKANNAAEKDQATKTIEVEYRERKRIAADLHDGLGSILSSIALFIKLAEKENEGQTNKNLERVKELSDVALDSLEAAINNLSPSNLERNGLINSLEIVAHRISDAGNVECKVIAPSEGLNCDPNLKINLFRICNELINNSIKHSEASKLIIEIKKLKKRIEICYKDNGKGFNTDLIFTADKEKMGLRNIVNRVESLGGKYHFNSSVGNGVEFYFWFKN
jgi:signal transduction histidine kinase